MTSLRRSSLAIWLVAALLVTIVLGTAASHRADDKRNAVVRAEAEVQRLVQAAEAALNRNLLAVDLLLASLGPGVPPGASAGAGPDEATLARQLQRLAEQSLMVRELVVVADDGRALASARAAWRGAGLPLPTPFLQGVLAQPYPALAVSAPAVSPATGEHVLYLARPLQLSGGRQAVVAAEVPLPLLAAGMDQIGVAAGLEMTLEREDGQLMASLPPNNARLGQRLAPALATADADGKPRQAAARLSDAPALLAVRPTLYPALLVAVGLPLATIEAQFRSEHRSDWRSSIGFSLLILLVAALAQWHLARLVMARRQVMAAHQRLQAVNAELKTQIAAREHSEADRNSTQRLLGYLLATTHEGFWFIDNEARTTDVNPAMCALLGRPRQAIIGHSIVDFVDAANAAVFRRETEARQQHPTGTYELSLQRPDGTQVECLNNATAIYDAQGLRIGTVGLLTDITAIKATQRELGAAKATLDQALDAMVEGLAIFDADDRLLLWNRRYLEMFPYLRSVAVRGAPTSTLAEAAARAMLPEASEAERRAYIAERLRARSEAVDSSELLMPDATVVQVTDRRMADGSLVSVFRDITQARAASRALEEARDAAQAAAMAKTRFLAAMSHEIRTPLNAVLGMNGLLQDTALTAEQRDYVDLIGKSGESLLAVINDILDLSRLESGHMALEIAPFSLGAAVADVVSIMTPRALAKGLALEAAIAPDLPAPLLGDASRLRQVLFNLIGNAIKFTEAGKVTVEVSHQPVSPTRVGVTVAVIDTGIGVAVDELPRLFQRFSQADSSTSRRYGGSGLGLAISREIVTLMGGRIEVDSQPGRGSTFRVSLAFDRGLPAAAQAEPAGGALPAATPRSGLRILVAEDNSVNQVLIRAVLAHLGHYQDVVGDGIEVVRQVQAAPYDVVLMDVQMPQMDGLAATRAIRALPGPVARIPIVAMTANVMVEDRDACLAAGMDDFVGKPIDRALLQSALERATRRSDAAA